MHEIIRLMTHYPDTFRDFYERLPALRPTLGCVESIDLVLLQATLLVEPLHADSPSRQPAFLGITRVDLGCPVQNVIGDNRRLSHNAVD